MQKIMIMMVSVSLFVQAGFSRNNSTGIVTDSITSLQWQDDYTPNNPNIRDDIWSGAISYCTNLALGGYHDWRLPNVNELETIIDYSKSGPAISNVFKLTKSNDVYWSSTTYLGDTNYAWYIFSGNGRADYLPKEGYIRYIRCVRSGE